MLASIFAEDGAIMGPVCAEHGQKHSVKRNFLIKFFSLSLHPCTWICTHTTVEQGSQEENHSNQWDMRKLYLHSHRVILYILFVCCCFLILRAFMSVDNQRYLWHALTVTLHTAFQETCEFMLMARVCKHLPLYYTTYSFVLHIFHFRYIFA